MPDARRPEQVQHLLAIDEIQLRQGQDAVVVGRGLKQETVALQRLGCDGPGHAQRGLDPAAAWTSSGLKHGTGGDLLAILENADLAGERMHLDPAPAGAVGHAVKVAADRNHRAAIFQRKYRRSRCKAVTGHAPIQLRHDLKRSGKQRLEAGPLLSGMRGHPRRVVACTRAWATSSSHPAQLLAQVVEVAEAVGKEEVLADVAERALDLALPLDPVRSARFGREAVVVGACQQGCIADDARITLPGDRGAHAVAGNLGGHAA